MVNSILQFISSFSIHCSSSLNSLSTVTHPFILYHCSSSLYSLSTEAHPLHDLNSAAHPFFSIHCRSSLHPLSTVTHLYILYPLKLIPYILYLLIPFSLFIAVHPFILYPLQLIPCSEKRSPLLSFTIKD